MVKPRKPAADSVAEGILAVRPQVEVHRFVVIGDSAVVVEDVRHVTGDVLELELPLASQLVQGGHVWALKGDTSALMDPSAQARLLDPGVPA